MDEPLFRASLRGSYLQKMTEDEFLSFCRDNEGYKFERDPEGWIICEPPTTFITGDRNSEVIMQLRNWNKQYKLGRSVDSDTGFYLPNGAMRNPDAAWISFERLNQLKPEDLNKFPHVCPDFVVELRSREDNLNNLKIKMREWIKNGCRLAWLIDADEEIVYIYFGQEVKTHHPFDCPLSGEPVLPGFQLILSELRV
ncbi:MAG: Uma2 family endonuclease [Bacteroidota bacterium]